MEKIVSRIVIMWILIIALIIGNLNDQMDSTEALFYRFGPHNNLLIIGIKINTFSKYFAVIIFCFINSLIRNITHNILNSWLINKVQDISIVKSKHIHFFAYEVTYVTTIYVWVDWYVYMNLLLAQVDMFLTEITADLIMSGFVTYYYLNTTSEKEKEKETIKDNDDDNYNDNKEIETVNKDYEVINPLFLQDV